MLHDDLAYLAVADLVNGLKEVNDGLFKPEVRQTRFLVGAVLPAHLQGLYDARCGFKDWRAPAHAERLNPAEVQIGKQLDEPALRVGKR